ncbi:MAG: acetyl-CoA C-acyltransferase [Deltaproteobacteria bacterium]|nr:MAG: acetyl-CoA C-acyltransferase [Deltaproteobacteria bacterium]
MKEVVIISAVRTPVGRYMGALKNTEAYDLAASVLNAAVEKAHISPDQIDEVIMGQSYQNGEYVNIARMALLQAGWPDHIPGVTLDRRCCTGLEVVRYAASLIRSNEAEIVLAGGVESMSNAEFYLPGRIKWGIGGQGGMPKGHGDGSIWGLPFYDRIQRARVMSQPEARYGILPSMMSWAETAAEEEGISREACDQWSLESHRKAVFAASDGRFSDEILALEIPGDKGAVVLFDADETPRPDTSIEKLAGLKPVLGGVCTAGNSSTESDGAAAVVVTSAEKARELGVEPLASIQSCAVVGGDPKRAYQTVPFAVKKALGAAQITLDQVGCIEIQEAFAAQVLADLKAMGLRIDDYGKINVNGSGISLGHPIACTGTRVLVTLLHELKRSNIEYGLASICGGGGLGIAAVLKKWL